MLDTLIKDSQNYLFNNLLPKWLKHGIHPELGYSYESLSHDWHVNPLGRIRLLTQCRQLYTFSHAYIETHDPQWQAPLQPLFEFILKHYWVNDAWIFSLNDDLSIKDSHSDCYTLAFVLLALSYYFEATNDDRALEWIEHTHQFLKTNMADPQGGFIEAFPPADTHIKKQNPHMHLLEGYIAAYNVTKKSHYQHEVEALLELMMQHFFDAGSNSLIELFHDDWSIHTTLGQHIEPGHHFEWVWLLHQANRLFPNKSYLLHAQALWDKACYQGFDPKGGIYNQVHATSAKVLDAEKRIWPATEYLKALCIHQTDPEQVSQGLHTMLSFLFDTYFKQDGAWNEYLDADNIPKPHPLPGTSSYHIFLGLIEVLKWYNSYGKESTTCSEV